MQATQILPPGYQAIGTLDVSKNQRLLLILNLIGLVVMCAAGFLFFQAIFWLRPLDSFGSLELLSFDSFLSTVGLIAAILALTALHIVLHEAIHGIFFWLYTRSRPRFAFRWSYAYAAAPDWYIPRDPFFITTLAPLVVMSLVGLALFPFVPVGWLLPIWLVITMNAGGAVGDLAVAGWLLRQPPTCLAQDHGDAVTLFVPE